MEATTILKNAEDYVLVLLITDLIWCSVLLDGVSHCFCQSMFTEYGKARTLQSNGNMFPFMSLKCHTASV